MVIVYQRKWMSFLSFFFFLEGGGNGGQIYDITVNIKEYYINSGGENPCSTQHSFAPAPKQEYIVLV